MIRLTEAEYETLRVAIYFALHETVNYQVFERLIKLYDEFEKHKDKVIINICIEKDGE